MAKARQAISLFRKWKGLKEGPAVDKAIIDPWNKATGCHAESKKNPWCAIAVASDFIQIKCSGYSKASTCKTQKEYYKDHKRWIAKGQRPNPGDVIFVTGHEGLITSTSTNGTGKFISGNCSNTVKETSFNWKKAKWGTKAVQGYGRPIYK